MRRIIRWLVILVAILAILLVGAEFAARQWLNTHPVSTITTMAFRALHPAAYANSSYYSPDFLAEQEQVRKNDLQSPDDDSFVSVNFQGKYYRFDKGFRVTVVQPSAARHTIWMFGDSTLVGSEVPDEYTIPSQLQLMLNSKEWRFRVENRGIAAAVTSQQVRYLKTLDVKPGDVVIVYGGTTDTLNILTSALNRRQDQLLSKLCSRLETSRLRGLALTQVACNPLRDVALALNDESRLRDTAQQVAAQLRISLLDARRWTEARGATFFFFLQPHLFSQTLSSYEQQLTAIPSLIRPQEEAVFSMTWPFLVNLSASLPGADLTHILDMRRTQGSEFYLDAHHVTDQANNLIARAIFDTLSRQLLSLEF